MKFEDLLPFSSLCQHDTLIQYMSYIQWVIFSKNVKKIPHWIKRSGKRESEMKNKSERVITFHFTARISERTVIQVATFSSSLSFSLSSIHPRSKFAGRGGGDFVRFTVIRAPIFVRLRFKVVEAYVTTWRIFC